jgi:orotate phosphoribosyltransferase
LIALDREEKGQGDLTAVEEVAKSFDLRVTSIVGLGHIMAYLEATGLHLELQAIEEYRVAAKA